MLPMGASVPREAGSDCKNTWNLAFSRTLSMRMPNSS
jgi:hypothetical protein